MSEGEHIYITLFPINDHEGHMPFPMPSLVPRVYVDCFLLLNPGFLNQKTRVYIYIYDRGKVLRIVALIVLYTHL